MYRLFVRSLAALVLFSAASGAALFADDSTEAKARQGLAQATAYLISISTHGGYLWTYSTDLKHRAGEGVATPTQIWVQPPGTSTMGRLFVRAYLATGDKIHLQAARAAALALVQGQLESGGWDYMVEFDPAERAKYHYRVDPAPANAADKRRNVTTYDDNTTQSALRFLLAYLDAVKGSETAEDAQIRAALDYGLLKLLASQYPAGGWPQRWDGRIADPKEYPVQPASFPDSYPRQHPKTSYYRHYTLNDNAHRDMLVTLLDAHRKTGRAEYGEALQRGIRFLKLAQLPEPQPAWAQQYNAALQPAWARAFEPPAVCSAESANVVRLLLELYSEMGDESLLATAKPALAWLKRSEIAPGRWARLYELQTNRPIYGDRDGVIHLTREELSDERQNGYAWEGEFDIPAVLEEAAALETLGREEWRKKYAVDMLGDGRRRLPANRLEPRAEAVLAEQDASGRWVSPRAVKRMAPAKGPWIEMGLFAENMRLLCDYLEAAKREKP